MPKSKPAFAKASAGEEKKYSLSAGFIVLNQNNEVLIMYQVENQYWEFPKGKVEPDEDVWETAVRELAEETGITKFKQVKEFKEEINYQFEIKGELIKRKAIYFLITTTQDVKLSHEHQEYKWISLAAADQYLKHDNQRKLINKIKLDAISI